MAKKKKETPQHESNRRLANYYFQLAAIGARRCWTYTAMANFIERFPVDIWEHFRAHNQLPEFNDRRFGATTCEFILRIVRQPNFKAVEAMIAKSKKGRIRMEKNRGHWTVTSNGFFGRDKGKVMKNPTR